jgi:SAM-dependent methyltransferase
MHADASKNKIQFRVMVFEKYAQFYDLLYQEKEYVAEVDYIDNLLNYYGESNNILEFGCGTGKHANLLTEKGYTVHGVDISQEMLNQAHQHYKIPHGTSSFKLSFEQGDIRTYETNKTYDSVLSLFHVFCYLTRNNEIDQAFASVNHHLRNNGIFIFDIWYTPAVLNLKPLVKIKKFENDDFFINRISNPEHKTLENIVTVHYEFYIKNKKTSEWSYLQESHSIRYFSIPEIEYFSAKNGFSLIHTEEWLTKKQSSENTWGITCVLKKIHNL